MSARSILRTTARHLRTFGREACGTLLEICGWVLAGLVTLCIAALLIGAVLAWMAYR